jgi:hypothetical protein
MQLGLEGEEKFHLHERFDCSTRNPLAHVLSIKISILLNIGFPIVWRFMRRKGRRKREKGVPPFPHTYNLVWRNVLFTLCFCTTVLNVRTAIPPSIVLLDENAFFVQDLTFLSKKRDRVRIEYVAGDKTKKSRTIKKFVVNR